MDATFQADPDLERVVAFHGHMCGGIAIGLQAARLARFVLGEDAFGRPEELVAVVETDMCAVDAIQVMTGCTIGKGNMVHRDWGKNAYTFYDRATGRAIRIAPKNGWNRDPELDALMVKSGSGVALDAEETARMQALRRQWERQLLAAAPESLFTVEELAGAVPPPQLRDHPRVPCQGCDEEVAESQIHRLRGRTLCAPCLEHALAAYV